MKNRLCFIVSAPATATAFLNEHIDYLSTNFDITVACKFDGSESLISQRAHLQDIRIHREISLFADLKALVSLFRFLRRERFQIVHSVTPKAGLIAAIAGYLARVPVRIHWFTGQVWALKSGFPRKTLKTIDRLIASLDSFVLVDSPSQFDFLLAEKVIDSSRSYVLGCGSISGVNSDRFRPSAETKKQIRTELGVVNPDAIIILFVGRLKRDKGIDALLKAFAQLELPGGSILLLVGADEENYIPRIQGLIGDRSASVKHIPHTSSPEKYMASADIYTLPSLREGFGLSIIEASACSLPIVASKIYGVSDAVSSDITGILVEPNNPDQIAEALKRLAIQPSTRSQMGLQGRTYVKEKFDSKELNRLLSEFYEQSIQRLDVHDV